MKTILKVAIADDHPMMRKCLLHLLSQWGYEITIDVSSGQDLINQITTTGEPDICILGFNVPDLNSFEVLRIIKESWPGIKIVLFSMNTTSSNRILKNYSDAIVSKMEPISTLKKTLQQFAAVNLFQDETGDTKKN